MNRYRHYKTGKLYEMICLAKHTETYEEMVVYRALYHCDHFGDQQIWIRPKKMFFEWVTHDGKQMPRFTSIEDEFIPYKIKG